MFFSRKVLQGSYKLQLAVAAVHPPVHKRQHPLAGRLSLPRFLAAQAAVLVARHGHHALQVQLLGLVVVEAQAVVAVVVEAVVMVVVVAVEAVVEPRQHLLPPVAQPLALAAQHPQRQHDQQHQHQAASDGHGDHRRPEPHLPGRAQLLHPGHQVPVGAVQLVAVVIWCTREKRDRCCFSSELQCLFCKDFMLDLDFVL